MRHTILIHTADDLIETDDIRVDDDNKRLLYDLRSGVRSIALDEVTKLEMVNELIIMNRKKGLPDDAKPQYREY